MATINIGDGDDLGVLETEIANDNITIGTGIGDFVEAGISVEATDVTASALDIGNDTITFGNGADNFVEVGSASATLITDNATASATGNITSDNIACGNGVGDTCRPGVQSA